jgi:ABC-type bacteriocin/lantibiotic exporter with double-glycine peptidase domain
MAKGSMNLHFFKILKHIQFKKDYVVYALLYGATSLIIPLTTQYLVNNLIIAGLWQSTLSFIILITVGLIFSQVLRFGMVILKEYIEREVFIVINKFWKNFKTESRYYYLETFQSLKSFSKTLTDFIDISLTVFFGMLTVIFFHPGFIILPLLILASITYLWSNNQKAIKSAIKESDEKYKIFENLNQSSSTDKFEAYLEARHLHLSITKKNNLIIGIVFVLSQIILIKLGVYFIEKDSLSVGQLVSTEIILSGIFGTLIKYPQTLEALYDFETSLYKIKKAQGEVV